MTKKFDTIDCPYCGAEYLPAEIYVPSAFFGKPTNIIKTDAGKIADFLGSSADKKETYRCDFCNNVFNVEARVSFSATKDDFDEEYSTKLKGEFSLKED